MKSVLLLFLLFASNIVNAQSTDFEISKKNKKFIKEVSNIIKENSLFSDSLNWKIISEELKTLQFRNNDSSDHNLVLNYFIKKLRNVGDKHSLYLTQENINSFTSKNTEPKLPESKYVECGIGYIKVPSCMTFNNIKDKDFANSIRHQIRKLDVENEIIGWIVDLRNNGGGNMWPMVAGLNAMMNDGTFGYSVGNRNKKRMELKIENGKINYSKELIDTYKIKNINAKIAVLINSKTGSSGEMTAISFIGLPNVKLFGEPSAGFTTINSTFYLSDGMQFFLTTNFIADRTYKIYNDRIIPDATMQKLSGFNEDETLENSKNWILKTNKK